MFFIYNRLEKAQIKRAQIERRALLLSTSLLSALLLVVSLILPAQLNALGSDEAENIRVYESASRSVVNITNTTVRYDAFYRAIPMEDAGAGIVIDKSGRVLTSLHLIDGALKLSVRLYDGTNYEAGIVGVDVDTDIAVLKIDAPEQLLYPVRFARGEELKVGSKVLAIGNPFGLEKSLSVGIVSSTSRRIRASSGAVVEGLIQTDAATNPGSSGGPLLNGNSEMVGLNAAIFSPVPGSVGVGLAIPVSVIEKSIAGIARLGEYKPNVWIGFTGQDMDLELAGRLEFKVPGILVASVFELSPAGKAGVRGATGLVNLPVKKGQLQVATGGDFIVDIDGKKVEKMEAFNEHVSSKYPGTVVKVGLLRDGRRKEIDVTLERRPRIR